MISAMERTAGGTQVDAEELLHQGEEMEVGIVEAGHHRPAPAIDDPGFFSDHCVERVVTGHQRYFIAGDGHQFRATAATASMVMTLAFFRTISARIA